MKKFNKFRGLRIMNIKRMILGKWFKKIHKRESKQLLKLTKYWNKITLRLVAI
jgi:hypothetical protein